MVNDSSNQTLGKAPLDYRQAPDNHDIWHLPGDKGAPFFGHILTLYKDQLAFARQRYEQYGAVSTLKLGPFLKGVLALGPDIAQTILLDSDRNFSVEKGYEHALTEFFGQALLMRDFDEHRFHRRILQSAFKTPAMRGYVDTMNPILVKGIDSWESDEFYFYHNIKELLLNMTNKVFYGVDEGSAETHKLSQAFLNCTHGQEGLIRLNFPGFKYRKGMQGKQFLRAYIAKLIPACREDSGSSFLSYMAKEKDENGELFSDDVLIDHAGFLLFTAHDTTTSTLTHMMYYLARYPEWQERLREECAGVSIGELSYEDLASLPKLEWVFNESQRLHPSVQLMVRRNIREVELGGVHVPANTMIYQMPSFSTRLAGYWTNPDSFDPERFSAQRVEHKSHPFAFMPFGGGAHKCIGMHFGMMQSKLFMYQFLKRYRFRLPANYQPVFRTVPLPKLEDNLPLIIERL